MEKRSQCCPAEQSTNLAGDPRYRQTILSGHRRIKPPLCPLLLSLSSLSPLHALCFFLLFPLILSFSSVGWPFTRFAESNLHRVDPAELVSAPDTLEGAFFMMHLETLDLRRAQWISCRFLYRADVRRGISGKSRRYRLMTLRGQFDSNFRQCAGVFQRLPRREREREGEETNGDRTGEEREGR